MGVVRLMLEWWVGVNTRPAELGFGLRLATLELALDRSILRKSAIGISLNK